MSLFVGRFHPLLVHLPIGILLAAIFFEWLSRKEKFKSLLPAVRISLLGGAIAAALSCISGYLLSTQDTYQEEVLQWHLISGISTAIVSIGLYFLWGRTTILATRLYTAGCVLTFLLVGITGHLGGSLTHGSSYLSDALPAPFKEWINGRSTEERIIANIQDVRIYDVVIQPILNEKCVACHGESKQKGGLRLDGPEMIKKGGKKGKTVVAEKPFDSELIKRLYLPMKHEQHMPPAGKIQATAADVQLLQWWISQGAPFDKKVSELKQPETIKPILDGLQSGDPSLTYFASHGLPEQPAPVIMEALLDTLRNHNITVSRVTRESNYVTVSFLARPDATDQTLREVQPLTANLLELKLGNTKITRESVKWIGQCTHLTHLSMERTSIGDDGLVELKALSQLEFLNLVGTSVSADGIKNLVGMKKLKRIYCYGTQVQEQDLAALKAALPGVIIDAGGYQVPTTVDDTTKVTDKK